MKVSISKLLPIQAIWGNKNEEGELSEETSEDEEVLVNEEEKKEWFEDEQPSSLSVDVYDSGDGFIIKSTLAGVTADDIKIIVDEQSVKIEGRREQEEKIAADRYVYQECYWGSFERVIKLPLAVDKDKVEANLKNGVLTIKLVKASKSEPRVVRVSS